MDQIEIKGKSKYSHLLCQGRRGGSHRADPPHVRLSDDGRLADPHHAGCACGKGCTIGTTMTIRDKAVPTSSVWTSGAACTP